ncbi:MAG: DedA family protein [Candidatus Pacebacteria bacterium]|nr:DedA family protein [Candidatus Paceibacterota bacterium]
MLTFLKDKLEYIKISLMRNISGPNAKWWLFGISFSESSFFPIPPDFYLMPVVARNKDKWLFFAFITTLASILGGLFGYFIGAVLFETVGKWLVSVYHLEKELETVGVFFNQNAFLSIFTAAFTPIPYKVFTIAAGLFKLNIFVFMMASILGRGMRFFIVAYVMKLFGEKISNIVLKYFNIATTFFALLVILFIAYKLIF